MKLRIPKNTTLTGTYMANLVCHGKSTRMPVQAYCKMLGERTADVIEPFLNESDFASEEEYTRAWLSQEHRSVPIDRFIDYATYGEEV